MKINKHFKLDIIKRFMDTSALENFQAEYDKAKIIVQGREKLKLNEK